MKRTIISAVAIVAALAAGCGGSNTPPQHKVGISGLIGPLDIPYGVPPYPPSGITRLAADNSGNLIESIGGGAYGTIGGGGSGTIVDGGVVAPLSGIGSVASPLGLVLPDQTVLGNVSGGPAAAIGLTKAQELTRLGVSPYTDVRQSIFVRGQALCGTTINVIMGTEFFLNPAVGADWGTNLTGSGTALLGTTFAAGVVRIQSSATASSQAVVSLSGTSSPGSQIGNLKTTRWYAYVRAKMATGVDSASQVDFIELANIGGNSLLTFGQAGGVSTTNLRVRLVDGAGTQINNAAVTAAVDTNWHDVEVWNDGTNITVDLDAVQQYQTAITALASGDPMYIKILVANNGTAANREIDADRMYVLAASN